MEVFYDQLHKYSENSSTPLSWLSQVNIALQIAIALQYLHVDVEPPVLHHNVKSATVLLVDDSHAKLTDFGPPKLGRRDSQAAPTPVKGSYGIVLAANRTHHTVSIIPHGHVLKGHGQVTRHVDIAFSGVNIALQIAIALQYLHVDVEPPVLHHDVKSANVLLVDDSHAKLTDFGLPKLGHRDSWAAPTPVKEILRRRLLRPVLDFHSRVKIILFADRGSFQDLIDDLLQFIQVHIHFPSVYITQV
ncbi:hypothetical protein SUGI_0012870 [Cryptomeria japonica]|nr:hypothetical protein SUGI_0012870 [Cryptomeria japonica]